MSLINEALKKAQKQRTGESPSLSAAPTIGGDRPDQIARRGKASGLGEFLLPLGLGAAVVALVVVGAVFLFIRKSEPPAPAAPPSVASATAAPSQPASPPVQSATPVQVPSQPVETTPPPPVVVAAAPQPEPAVSTFTVPNVTAPAPASPRPEPERPASPVVTLPAPAPVVATVTPPATPAPQPAQPATPATPPKFEPRAINHIEALRVAGIRVSSDPRESKVLMNDRVYRLGSLVEAEMGLRLVGITAASLTFEDDRGARYTRLFN